MFKDVVVSAADSTISTRWTWEYTPGCKEMPQCNHFACALKADIFLNNSLFLEEEIRNYFEKEVLKIADGNYAAAFNMYSMRYQNSSRLVECSLEKGDSIYKTVPFKMSADKNEQIYYVCVYTEDKHYAKVISTMTDEYVEVKKTGKKPFHKYQSLEIVNPDSRRKVLIKNCGKNKSYSVLPAGQNIFYFDVDFDLDSIEIKYLSMLMGSSGSSN